MGLLTAAKPPAQRERYDLVNAWDRHSGNILFGDGKIFAIDHGAAFEIGRKKVRLPRTQDKLSHVLRDGVLDADLDKLSRDRESYLNKKQIYELRKRFLRLMEHFR